MTLEELSVVFSADLAPFSAAADQLSAMLSQMGAQADALAGQFLSAGNLAGSQLGQGLQSSIFAQQEAVLSAASQLTPAASLTGLFLSAGEQAAFALANGLQSGMMAHRQAVYAAAGRLSPADLLYSQFQAAGALAGDGLRQGIQARQGSIVTAARAVAQAAANALRAALQIHSPSRITFETGRYFDEGLIGGIQSSAGRVEKEAGSLGFRAAQALAAPENEGPLFPASSPVSHPVDMDQALSRLSLTIPLEVDGYQLGVAAIEGINRVSRGSGRVELTM